MSNVSLSLALAVPEQAGNLARLVLDGTVKPDGIDLIPSDVYSGELIGRQLRFAEFDPGLSERAGHPPWDAPQGFKPCSLARDSKFS